MAIVMGYDSGIPGPVSGTSIANREWEFIPRGKSYSTSKEMSRYSDRFSTKQKARTGSKYSTNIEDAEFTSEDWSILTPKARKKAARATIKNINNTIVSGSRNADTFNYRDKARSNTIFTTEDVKLQKENRVSRSVYTVKDGQRTISEGRTGIFKKKTESSIFPGRNIKGEYTGDWGLEKEQVRAATAKQMLNRAKVFAFGGSGYKREALRNSFGLLSKQQKALEGMPGFMVAGQNALIGANLISDAWNGNFDDIGIDAGTYFGGAVGFRVGQALGTAYGKSELPGLQGISRNLGYRAGAARAGSLEGFFRGPAKSAAGSILRSGRLAGAIGGGIGALTGAAIVGGVAATVFGAVTSNNVINQAAYNVSKLELNHNFFETETSLTNRQRGLQAISKSAMNNRGQLLGNEASVLAFGY